MSTRSHIEGAGRTLVGILVAPIVALGVVWISLWVVIGVAWLLESMGLI